MGYTTDFEGSVKLSRELTAEEYKELRPMLEDRHDNNDTPGIWCGWTYDIDTNCIEWDYVEKFYSYVDWMVFLIDKYFKHWGIKLSGDITWIGEDTSDMGKIEVRDNVVYTYEGVVDYINKKEWK